MADVDGALRVMVISTVYRLNERVRNYVRALLEEEGLRVDLVFLGAEAWQEADPEEWAVVSGHPNLTLYTIDGAEQRHPLRRVERVLVHKAPRAVLTRATRLTEKVAPLRPLRTPAKALENGHRKVAGAFHKRLYIKAYRLARPSVLAKLFRQRLADVDFRTVDRVVAADVYAVTLSWQLARRHPHLVATTALERNLAALHEELRADG
ncbi:hypothetical protein O7606_09805 [Micromonospora sp. WMMD882]|uniref:hypothetical protein n=1 Tax=Micromonospora sp. WMMD882 TaxID=3015151 RepID=UPI00248BB108|nr:hypothetical protein [Micromonospora sp. WMMD882]WBB81625.1 hypothetical protein O7606_09805 [Micromonospora sp. WMMD882]